MDDIIRFPAPFSKYGYVVRNGYPIFYNGQRQHKNVYGPIYFDSSKFIQESEQVHDVSEEKIQTIETKPRKNPYKVGVNKLLLVAAMQPGSMPFEQIFDLRTGRKRFKGEANEPTVDHINGDSHDNSVINLHVITRSENAKKKGSRQNGSPNSYHYCIGPARLNTEDISEWHFAEKAKYFDDGHPLKPYCQVYFEDFDNQITKAILNRIDYMRLADDDPNTRCWIHPRDIQQRLGAIEQFKSEGAVSITHVDRRKNQEDKEVLIWVSRNGFFLRPGEPEPRKGLPKMRDTGLFRYFSGVSVSDLVYSAFSPGYDGMVRKSLCQHDHIEGIKLYPCDQKYEVDESKDPVEITFLEYLEAWEASVDEQDPSLKIYVKALYSNDLPTLYPKSDKSVYTLQNAKKDYGLLKLRGLYTYVPGETKLTDAAAIHFHQLETKIMVERVNPNSLDENIPAEHKGLKRHGEELEENQDPESAAKRQNRNDTVESDVVCC